MITQRDAVREVLMENIGLSYEDTAAIIRQKFNISVPPSVFYSVRAEMGYGVRRNGKTRLTAEIVNNVRDKLRETRVDASTLLAMLEDFGYGTLKEVLKLLCYIEKS